MSENVVVKYLCDRGTSTRSSRSGPNINQLQKSVRSLQTQMTELHKQVVFIIERQTKILLLLDKENVNKSESIRVLKKREDSTIKSNAKAHEILGAPSELIDSPKTRHKF